MKIESPAFRDGEAIPVRYTGDGENHSPPLEFGDVPGDAKSLALIVDDPDAPDPEAPRQTWVHWVVYNLPPDAGGLAEDASAAGLPASARQGMNDSDESGYDGPLPPRGRHRYFHKLYALDQVLPEMERATSADLERAMEGHVLAKAELVGTYARGG